MAFISFTTRGYQEITINGTSVSVNSSSIYQTDSRYVTIERVGGRRYESDYLRSDDMLEVVLTVGGDIVCRTERLDGHRSGFLSLHATKLAKSAASAEQNGTTKGARIVCIVLGALFLFLAIRSIVGMMIMDVLTFSGMIIVDIVLAVLGVFFLFAGIRKENS